MGEFGAIWDRGTKSGGCGFVASQSFKLNGLGATRGQGSKPGESWAIWNLKLWGFGRVRSQAVKLHGLGAICSQGVKLAESRTGQNQRPKLGAELMATERSKVRAGQFEALPPAGPIFGAVEAVRAGSVVGSIGCRRGGLWPGGPGLAAGRGRGQPHPSASSNHAPKHDRNPGTKKKGRMLKKGTNVTKNRDECTFVPFFQTFVPFFESPTKKGRMLIYVTNPYITEEKQKGRMYIRPFFFQHSSLFFRPAKKRDEC